MSRSEISTIDEIDTRSEVDHKNVTGTTFGSKRGLDMAPMGADGVTDVDGNPIVWDNIAYAEPTTASETYTYSFGGSDLVVYTITYTDATKATLAANAVVKSAP